MKTLLNKSTLFWAFMFLGSGAWAQNDCSAVVTPTSVSRLQNTTIWRFEFAVSTSCAHSHGQFVYTFKAEGKSYERDSPSWTSADGKNPKIVDEHNVGSKTVDKSSVTIKPGSIKSTNTGN